MNKDTIIGAIVLIIIFVGIIIYAAFRPAPAKAPGTVENAPALLGGGYVEHAQYYDIAANYASSTPLAEPANSAAVALMKSFISDSIVQFKTDGNFANLTPADIATMGFDQGRKETLQITYLIGSSPRTVTYIYTTYMDTLGAHGNTFFHTFTFDTVTGAPLGLADIFSPGADYLGKLSAESRAKLPGVIGQGYDMNFIKDGTTPDEKNFVNFFFDNRELVILFPPYQVAPYSFGPQTLRIPLSDLTSILKPEYK